MLQHTLGLDRVATFTLDGFPYLSVVMSWNEIQRERQ
jgi:hypothetical protein